MKRRNFIRNITTVGLTSFFINPLKIAAQHIAKESTPIPQNTSPAIASKVSAPVVNNAIRKQDFGKDFRWGVTTAAYQIEGAWNIDGKGESIWDHFTHTKASKIRNKQNGDIACNFYNRYPEDIGLLKEMNFDVHRFSLSWSRIFPNGIGERNQKGIDFYNRVIDLSLEKGVEPWITLYHWDLPQKLEDKGGWANRDVIAWFEEYSNFVTQQYGDRVKNWIVMNEPSAFNGLGYLTGLHAPGKRYLNKFMGVVHHTIMAIAAGGRIVRNNVENAHVGTTFACSPVHPASNSPKDKKAAHRADILLNRFYIEPLLGLGYPTEDFTYTKGIYKFIKEGDMEKINFNFDFIGLQNYFRVVIKHSPFVPLFWAKQVKPTNRGIASEKLTTMGWEVYPEGMYEILKQFATYSTIPPIIVTENGAAFNDIVTDGHIHDKQRIDFFQSYLNQILRAKNEGVKIDGYFVWTLTDNFEWAEGFNPRFGLVHVDFETQQRIIKDSGLWFKDFLKQ